MSQRGEITSPRAPSYKEGVPGSKPQREAWGTKSWINQSKKSP